ncbi:KCNN protein, partial [Acromyrmex heyeri]
MNTNGNAVGQEGGAGTDYGSNEETAALLGRPPPPPPQVQQSQLQAQPTSYRSSRQSHQYRCRCDRRDSLAPTSALHLARSVSRESVKSGHHCCPCQAPPPPVLVTTSPNARIIRQSSQPEASACCCSGCCCPLHTGAAPSAASLRQLREPGDGIAGIAADSLRINGGIRQFRQFPWWCKSSSSTMAAATTPSSMAAGAGPASAGAASGTQGGQGVVLCPRTLSQVRRTRLRRALTEATAETVNYVKTVGDDDFSLSSPIMRVYQGVPDLNAPSPLLLGTTSSRP